MDEPITAAPPSMTKRQVVRIELIALAVLGGLLLARLLAGPPRPDGLVAFTDLEPNALRRAAFEVERPLRAVIDATGSYDEAGSDGPDLAAYGWIMREGEAAPFWHMASAARPQRGTLALVRDTLTLPPGRYRAYFASYGNALSGRGSLLARLFGAEQPWRGDRSKWSMVLRSLDERAEAERLPDGLPEAEALRERFFWHAAPVESDETRAQLLEVTRPVDVRVEATGEIGRERDDYGWIERVPEGEVVWAMTSANTQPAGGADVNRRFDGTVTLAPGLYRAAFQTDASHAYDDWRANPPFSPDAWGLTLAPTAPADRDAIVPFDPQTSRPPLIAIDSVGDDVFIGAQFVVGRPLPVIVQALGEVRRDRAYDYAWIENDSLEEAVWEMDWAASQPAGGASKNRQATAFLTLDPGLYTLYYQTDGSHSYGGFNAEPPAHPERWGVALFPQGALPEDTTAFRVLHVARTEGERPDDPPAPLAPPLATGEVLLDETRLGNDADVQKAFALEETSTLRVRATGEISLGGHRYDYGWIERLPDGETVWEMNGQNTRPAGGHDKNRRFDGTITLPPGRYVAHFKTDFSHAYGSFGPDAPDDPEAWGIAVERVE